MAAFCCDVIHLITSGVCGLKDTTLATRGASLSGPIRNFYPAQAVFLSIVPRFVPSIDTFFIVSPGEKPRYPLAASLSPPPLNPDSLAPHSEAILYYCQSLLPSKIARVCSSGPKLFNCSEALANFARLEHLYPTNLGALLQVKDNLNPFKIPEQHRDSQSVKSKFSCKRRRIAV